MASAAPGANLHRVPSNTAMQQPPPQPQMAPQPGQTVLIQQQPGQPPVAATVAVLKRPPSNGMLAAQPGQQPIAMMMNVDPLQPGAATVVVPAAALAGGAGVPVQVVQQVQVPAQAVALQPAQPGAAAAILQVQQPVQPEPQQQQPTAAATAAATTGQQGGQQVNTLPQAFEKKLRRLEKNRESARECRRRKKEHVQELQKQVARLEAENLRLKLQLKVGEESEAQERQEKERITKKLDEMVKSGASEADIWQTIDMFKERYSDYGSDRRSAIEFHTNQLEKLLLPTKLTKLCMWMLLNMDMDVDIGEAGGASAPALKADDAQPGAGAGAGTGEVMPPPAPPAAPPQQQQQSSESAGLGGEAQPPAEAPVAARRLWATVAAELGVTAEQQRRLLAQRETVKGMDGDLQVTSGMLSELRALINDKNASLDQELLEVQKILSPTQTAKFILWITKNPACMHMLNQLWRLVYEKAQMPGAAPAPAPAPAPALGGAGMEDEGQGPEPAAKRAKLEGGSGGNGSIAVAQEAGPL